MMQIVRRLLSLLGKGEPGGVQEYREGDAAALQQVAEGDGGAVAYDGIPVIDVSALDDLPEFELIDPPVLPPEEERRRAYREEELASKRATIAARRRIREERMGGSVSRTVQAHSDGRAEYRR
ncbi:MAG: hypothetical protein QMC96_04935 [Methanomicrobiales archaeon]|nr:hypothetical protein [Methanomicrobiales archaeon]